MLDIVLAAALLVAPESTDANLIETLRPTLITLAVSGEILDPRERNYTDLEMLQQRYAEFKNYPNLGECQRFPGRKLLNDYLTMNRAFRHNLYKRLEMDPIYEDIIRDAIVETDQLYQVWDTIRDAECEYYYVTVRRQALKLLKELVGDESFYSGRMPPNVPVWHIGN